MCETVAVCAGFWNIAMVWQPMPASARAPSGTRVDRLCGQPEQNAGGRTRPGAAVALAALPRHDIPQSGSISRRQSKSACAICGGASSPTLDSTHGPGSASHSCAPANLPTTRGLRASGASNSALFN